MQARVASEASVSPNLSTSMKQRSGTTVSIMDVDTTLGDSVPLPPSQLARQHTATRRAAINPMDQTRKLKRSDTRELVDMDRRQAMKRHLTRRVNSTRGARSSESRYSSAASAVQRSGGVLSTIRRWREAPTAQQLKFAALDSSSPLGACVSESELLRLSNACRIVKVAAGRPLPDSPFYLIMEGRVDVLDENGHLLVKRERWAFFTKLAGQLPPGMVDDEPVGAAPAVGLGRNRRSSISNTIARITERRASRATRPGEYRLMETNLVASEASKVVVLTSEDALERFYNSLSPAAQHQFDTIINTNLTCILSPPFELATPHALNACFELFEL
jgi:hypothetical protein